MLDMQNKFYSSFVAVAISGTALMFGEFLYVVQPVPAVLTKEVERLIKGRALPRKCSVRNACPLPFPLGGAVKHEIR